MTKSEKAYWNSPEQTALLMLPECHRAFSEVTLGFFDREQKPYLKIPIKEQVEALSFTGNIVRNDG